MVCLFCGLKGIWKAVKNYHLTMQRWNGGDLPTHAKAHSEMGPQGIFAAVENYLLTMQHQNGGDLPIFEEAHSEMSRQGGNRPVETAGNYRANLGRPSMTMEDMRDLAASARKIDNNRQLCTNGCGRVQTSANDELCQYCITENNKRKREEDEEVEEEEPKLCVSCETNKAKYGKAGHCKKCYNDPVLQAQRLELKKATKKLCTHVSGCINKGLSRRVMSSSLL